MTTRPPRTTPRQAIAARGPASGVACSRLRALIVQGQLAPGAPLIESMLAARLGVSRTPVRAALLRLEQEGLVRRTPGPAPTTNGWRAVVSPLTAGDLREIFLMAGALEAMVARQAAALDGRRRIALAATLANANLGLRAAIAERPPDLAAAQDLHARFHRACVDMAGGPRLRAEVDTLAPQVARYLRVYSAATIYAIDEFVAGHEAMTAAIRAGDGDAAERAAGADWRVTADRHGELVAILGERGTW
jgi:DNA-binding GntR family transcriptional regulator